MRRVALTGGIATGKSYVRERFDALGVPTIDADRLAHDAVAPGTPGFGAVLARFGAGVLAADGSLDRRALGAIVFANPDARLDLEAIVHPDVRRRTDEWFASLQRAGHRVAIADIPLLYEVGRERDFDAVIVVACEPDRQVARVVARDGVTTSEAHQRIAAQLPIAEKIARADYVIDTNGTPEQTNEQVHTVFTRLHQ